MTDLAEYDLVVPSTGADAVRGGWDLHLVVAHRHYPLVVPFGVGELGQARRRLDQIGRDEEGEVVRATDAVLDLGHPLRGRRDITAIDPHIDPTPLDPTPLEVVHQRFGERFVLPRVRDEDVFAGIDRTGMLAA